MPYVLPFQMNEHIRHTALMLQITIQMFRWLSYCLQYLTVASTIPISYPSIFVEWIYPMVVMLRLVLDIHPTDIHHIQYPKRHCTSCPSMVRGADVLCIGGVVCCAMCERILSTLFYLPLTTLSMVFAHQQILRERREVLVLLLFGWFEEEDKEAQR